MTKYSFEFNLKVVNVYLSGGYRFLTEKYHVKGRKKIHHWVNTCKEFDTDMLKQCIDEGADYDLVIAIGSIIMMKMVSQLTKTYGIKTIVSMNPVMVDGTGMCGGCRVTVDGKIKFACVDGPDFDGHQVDFDEAMRRQTMYQQ